MCVPKATHSAREPVRVARIQRPRRRPNAPSIHADVQHVSPADRSWTRPTTSASGRRTRGAGLRATIAAEPRVLRRPDVMTAPDHGATTSSSPCTSSTVGVRASSPSTSIAAGPHAPSASRPRASAVRKATRASAASQPLALNGRLADRCDERRGVVRLGRGRRGSPTGLLLERGDELRGRRRRPARPRTRRRSARLARRRRRASASSRGASQRRRRAARRDGNTPACLRRSSSRSITSDVRSSTPKYGKNAATIAARS